MFAPTPANCSSSPASATRRHWPSWPAPAPAARSESWSEALDCAFLTPGHVRVLKAMLRRIDQLTADIAEVTARIGELCRPWEDNIARLCTRQPPFTSIKARQAVSYAIDRGRILQLYHFAPGQAAVTCQMLPAGFPATGPIAPTHPAPRTGTGTAPTWAALRLAKESRTTNVPVTIWSIDDPQSKATGSYLVRLLEDLGYKATLHAVSLFRILPKGPKLPHQDPDGCQRGI